MHRLTCEAFMVAVRSSAHDHNKKEQRPKAEASETTQGHRLERRLRPSGRNQPAGQRKISAAFIPVKFYISEREPQQDGDQRVSSTTGKNMRRNYEEGLAK